MFRAGYLDGPTAGSNGLRHGRISSKNDKASQPMPVRALEIKAAEWLIVLFQMKNRCD
jgi:hypothetical protein